MRYLSKPRPKVMAVLGPTNTGKTHFAIERMLSHPSGMIGLPLRLLAREVYDRIVKLRTPSSVALITGEEKLIPENPKFFVCTVEAMPLDHKVDCLVVDEIQLSADRDRGHIFTDRILYARGISETIFLGSDSIKPILKKLVPQAIFKKRERLSKLEGVGYQKLGKLTPRSAIITFSAQQVYQQAEALRSLRGGCVVVLGALSPRTRNAQIALYQSGEVDYMVATDAIGMGLNMELNHVAFASNTKFDGYSTRRLIPSEIAQIAGRAGRYLTNGTFGTTNHLPAFDDKINSAVEGHLFPAIRQIFWRNNQLDFSSINSLIQSLELRPSSSILRRKGDADDQTTLITLNTDLGIQKRINNPQKLKLLWETCQIPDFTKTLAENHVSLISKIFRNLCDFGYLPNSWVAGLVSKLDRTDGDIDTLTARISHIRTWTYIAHRQDWLNNTKEWQERTRAIEDRLSDALHQRLTQRFVEKRISIIAKSAKRDNNLLSAVKNNGEVILEGHKVGKLSGLLFRPEDEIRDNKAVITAVRRILPAEIGRLAGRIASSSDNVFTLQLKQNKDFFGKILWNGDPIAKLIKGQRILQPNMSLLPCEDISGEDRQRILNRLDQWVKQEIIYSLPSIFLLKNAKLSGPSAGIVYQLTENLCVVPQKNISQTLKYLTKHDRKILHEYGVIIGRLGVYLPANLKPLARNLSGYLWWVFNEKKGPSIQPHPTSTSIVRSTDISDNFFRAIGYEPLGPRLIRIDIAERIHQMLHKRAKMGPIILDRKLLGTLGCPRRDCAGILRAFGYQADGAEAPGPLKFTAIKSFKKHNKLKIKNNPNSPFSILSGLKPNKAS